MEVLCIKNSVFERPKLKRLKPLYFLKAGLGSAVAIILAESIGLLYSPSAGIITLLTIQDTKKETLDVAAKRIISFILAVTISYIMFNNFGYNPWVFGGFIFVFVGLSYFFNLKEGISMNAVLMTHFLIEKRVDLSLFTNEAMILGLGMVIGILINLIMPNYKKEIIRRQEILEEEIKKILKTMALALMEKTDSLVQGSVVIEFNILDRYLDELLQKAYDDAGNTLLSDTRYLISYLEMRRQQIEVLKDIGRKITEIPVFLQQSIPLADFIDEISESFHEMNNAIGLLESLNKLYSYYKQDKLPITREEFEYRAELFQILKDFEYFLQIKRKFVLEFDKKELDFYWSSK